MVMKGSTSVVHIEVTQVIGVRTYALQTTAYSTWEIESAIEPAELR